VPDHRSILGRRIARDASRRPRIFSRLADRLRGVASERGAAMVEFALVAPLLFLLLFGMLDFGKAFNYWNVEQQMANEGARLAAVNGNGTWTCPDGTPASLPNFIKCQAVNSELRNGSAQPNGSLPSGVTVCVRRVVSGSGPLPAGVPVRVTATVTYRWMPLRRLYGLANATAIQINGEATMRLEAPLTLPTEPWCST
jgi:Flp pilus assembly protein TadG